MSQDSPVLPEGFAAVPSLVVDWFRKNARDLPWRRDASPYRVLISEVMLQQTRVEAVKPYFLRFLDAFPDIHALANADDELLMKRWEGLGYYSRARNLKRCAVEVEKRFGGVIPGTVPELLSLPGIGLYTAGAVAAFAYGVPAPAVDGNVLRVVSRLLAESGDILAPAVRAALTGVVADWVPADAPGAFGQGMIELGALVCVPNAAPKCDLCVLAPYCRARAEGLTDVIPHRHEKAARKMEDRTVLVIRSGNRILLRKRPAKGLLAGLWELPSLPGTPSEEEILAFSRTLGLEPLRFRRLPDAKHIFTHIEWHMKGYLLRVAEPDGDPGDSTYVMPGIPEIAGNYALPSAFSPFLSDLLASGTEELS